MNVSLEDDSLNVFELKIELKSVIREMILYRNKFIKDRDQKNKFDSLKKRLEKSITEFYPYYSIEFNPEIKEYPKILTDIIKTLGKISEYWLRIDNNININYEIEERITEIDNLINKISKYNYLKEKYY